MNSVQELFPGGPGTALATQTGDLPSAGNIAAGPLSGAIGTDSISRLLPSLRQTPSENVCSGAACGPAGGLMQIIAQLSSLLQQLMSMAGLGQASNQTYFKNATASSTGDPHLAFSGTDASGTLRQARFDSMDSHSDLLDSNSFGGGYRIATTATAPDARGITYNRQATVSTDYGATQVSLDSGGSALVSENGYQIDLKPGQLYSLSNSETVSRTADGSVVVQDRNAAGGNITTTLRRSGQGVDVSATARDVNLGGDLRPG